MGGNRESIALNLPTISHTTPVGADNRPERIATYTFNFSEPRRDLRASAQTSM